MSTTDALYERFKANLEAVNGECSLAAKADAGKVVADLFQAKGIKTACVAETDFLREIGIVPALREAGVEVFTDHIRLHAETAQGGITSVFMRRLRREVFPRRSTALRIWEAFCRLEMRSMRGSLRLCLQIISESSKSQRSSMIMTPCLM